MPTGSHDPKAPGPPARRKGPFGRGLWTFGPWVGRAAGSVWKDPKEVLIMKVLITAATKHGSTFEIASGIEDVLNGVGIDTVLTVPERVTDLDGYDAVILGSAVYAGHWLESAKDFVA